MTGKLTSFAAAQQREFDAVTSPSARQDVGHYGTPATVAEFMADMFPEIPAGRVRIVDPGAGVGMLSAAICQRVLRQRSPRDVEIELWENNPGVLPFLHKTMLQCRKCLQDGGHALHYVVRTDDFILSNTQKTLFDDAPAASFHLAILNPPYFKLRKDSPQAQAMPHVIHGQPNVYALFMAVAADLLLPNGAMVAITPRSYFNGPYFKRFRKWFFDKMIARKIHAFDSRKEAFRDDGVLQENVILLAEKGGDPRDVVLTTSAGRDLVDVERSTAPYRNVVDNAGGSPIVRFPRNRFEQEIIEALDRLPNRFSSLGFAISTGPVVVFRATEFLRDQRAKNTAPLLWMHNVRPFATRSLEKNGKAPHLVVNEDSKQLLLPAKRYVLLKRFTAKEEKRRLVAGIVESANSYSEWLGLENHLNYVYRRGSELTKAEAYGLAAFFNSALVDRYFRAISGNTQVNATEIRAMPVPDAVALARIGTQIEQAQARDYKTIEHVVGSTLRLPSHLIETLSEAAQ